MLHTPTIVPDWTADRRVRLLLASMAANPPATRKLRPEERWTTETSTYVGYRVECLLALWNEIAKPVLQHCDVVNDYAAWSRFCCQPSVDEAIANATLKADLDVICAEVLADAQDQFCALMAEAA